MRARLAHIAAEGPHSPHQVSPGDTGLGPKGKMQPRELVNMGQWADSYRRPSIWLIRSVLLRPRSPVRGVNNDGHCNAEAFLLALHGGSAKYIRLLPDVWVAAGASNEASGMADDPCLKLELAACDLHS